MKNEYTKEYMPRMKGNTWKVGNIAVKEDWDYEYDYYSDDYECYTSRASTARAGRAAVSLNNHSGASASRVVVSGAQEQEGSADAQATQNITINGSQMSNLDCLEIPIGDGGDGTIKIKIGINTTTDAQQVGTAQAGLQICRGHCPPSCVPCRCDCSCQCSCSCERECGCGCAGGECSGGCAPTFYCLESPSRKQSYTRGPYVETCSPSSVFECHELYECSMSVLGGELPRKVEVPVNIPVPLEETLHVDLVFPKIKPVYKKHEYTVILPRVVEVPYYMECPAPDPVIIRVLDQLGANRGYLQHGDALVDPRDILSKYVEEKSSCYEGNGMIHTFDEDAELNFPSVMTEHGTQMTDRQLEFCDLGIKYEMAVKSLKEAQEAVAIAKENQVPVSVDVFMTMVENASNLQECWKTYAAEEAAKEKKEEAATPKASKEEAKAKD